MPLYNHNHLDIRVDLGYITVSGENPRIRPVFSEAMQLDLPDQGWLTKASAKADQPVRQPFVSIFCFCKNRAATIRRCIESVLAQTYANCEFVIQDGASTDGTLEILQGYNDPRIKLVSEVDTGPEEGFGKVLRRCQGDIIASCLSDEELLPNAIEEAVELFAKFPKVGAITRDGYVTDASGNIKSDFIAGDFDFVDYLFGRYCPMWCASFFRREALV